MRDHPILFSGEMVRAILDGRKTQTRRVLRHQPTLPYYEYKRFIGRWAEFETGPNYVPLKWSEKFPYGRVGDHLWVRETWFPDPPYDDSWDAYMFDDGSGIVHMGALPKKFQHPEHVIYRASWQGVDLRWRPSIFMPRWASRITLEVTNVRVERLQEISQQDAKAEGVKPLTIADGGYVPTSGSDYIGAFRLLWNSLNSKRGYSWESNPWVWVIEFRKLKGGEK